MNTANVTAWGTYDDSATEVDITNLVSWNVDDETIAVISNGPGASDGIGGVVSNGTASDGTTTATAELDGITSTNAVNIAACNTLSGPCIDVFDNDGKLWSSSPSRKATQWYGLQIGEILVEERILQNMETYRTSQATNLCQDLSDISFQNRTNWRRSTVADLDELYALEGGMYAARGWPTQATQITPSGNGATVDVRHDATDLTSYGTVGQYSYAYDLRQGKEINVSKPVGTGTAFALAFVTCVSDAP